MPLGLFPFVVGKAGFKAQGCEGQISQLCDVLWDTPVTWGWWEMSTSFQAKYGNEHILPEVWGPASKFLGAQGWQQHKFQSLKTQSREDFSILYHTTSLFLVMKSTWCIFLPFLWQVLNSSGGWWLCRQGSAESWVPPCPPEAQPGEPARGFSFIQQPEQDAESSNMNFWEQQQDEGFKKWKNCGVEMHLAILSCNVTWQTVVRSSGRLFFQGQRGKSILLNVEKNKP